MLAAVRRSAAVAALASGLAVAGAALAAPPVLAAQPAASTSGGFYVPKQDHAATRQIADLTAQGRRQDAALVREMVQTPSAVWIEQGTPAEVERQVRQVLAHAAAKKQVPVLVAYNIPFRDCAQYSAGGATSKAEYLAWIAAVARAVEGARTKPLIMLEPDGLGIIPWYTTMSGEQDWCRPAEADADTAAAERFEMLNGAVDALTAAGAKVYLDGTHSGWLGVGEISDRLIKAGVTRAEGFFLNVSNYQTTERQVAFGSWISQCIYLDQNSWFDRAWCGSQYYPASPGDFSTWALTDATYDKAFADTGLARDWSAMPHFVVDTSRNGRGPWTPPAGVYPDPQDWCNPPDRGLGLRPTTATGSPLADAFLWIKTPGESDGSCTRGLSSGIDPEWQQVDPPAGAWFPEQALELAQLAQPPL